MSDQLVYTDAYGEVTAAQQRLYRKHNVSPSDHDMLVGVYGDGPGSREAIMAAVREHSKDGMHQEFLMITAARKSGLL